MKGMIIVTYICKKLTLMRSRLLLSVFSGALLLSASVSAQIPVVSKVAKKVVPEFTLGIKAGATFQKVSGSTTVNDAYNAGIVGGLFLGVTKGKFGVQAEGLIRSAKFDYNATISEPKVTLNTLNLDVPVLFEYSPFSRLWLQIGPQFSSIISGNASDNKDYKAYLQTSDFSGLAGLQIRLPIHLVAGARYIVGFADVNKKKIAEDQKAWNNRLIQLYIGYRFL